MQATNSGYLKDRSAMVFSEDASTGRFRAPVEINPHQIVSTTVEWGSKGNDELTESERKQLLFLLRQELSNQLRGLPVAQSGRPLILRAAITRAEVVSPGLNTLLTALLIGPLDRGGAAVELELLDAQTQRPVASLATAYYAPLSEFTARFSRLEPAELAVKRAAREFAQTVHPTPPVNP
jgi:hypothetical protein